MKVTAGIAITTFCVALLLPAMLFAQEPAPVEPAPVEPAPEEPAPVDPAEAPPPSTPEPPAPPAAPPVPDADTTAEPAAVAKASASVSIVDFAFSPSTVTINVGDSVTWVNNGEEDHDAVGNSFSTASPLAPGGGSDTVQFSSPGNFSYICSFHPDMKGTVVVNDTGGTNGGTEGDDGSGVDPATGAPLGTEAAAGTAPDAAGTGDALPASGEEEAPLAILGAGLLGCGLLAAALARWRLRETALLSHGR